MRCTTSTPARDHARRSPLAVTVLGATMLALGLFGCETELGAPDLTGIDLLGDAGDAANAGAPDRMGTDTQALTRQCRPSQTVKGVDVSYYQAQINWAQAKADGVEYAFIRVSDGTNFIDPRFQENWRNARAAGVRRGAYQFFRSNRDAIAQADLLLEQMGALEDGDLPPVIDVESMDGQSAATVRQKVQQWVNRVESRLGVKPIVYTGPYFWRDQVGGAAVDVGDHPLWIAHYGTTCPLVPEPWANFSFHQFTDAGRVAGITGNVDTNVFAGTLADLDAIAFHTETRPTEPSSDCDAIGPEGGIIDETSACFVAGGPTQWLRAVDGEGYDGGLLWTGATDKANRVNFGEWNLQFAEPGTYRVQVFTDMTVATSQLTKYRIEHDGVVETKQLSQRAGDGFRDLGVFTFTSGTGKIVLNDNTGEASSTGKKIVFDAIQLLPASPDDVTTPPPAPTPTCTQVRITTDSLNVRSTASTSRAAVGTVRRNDVVSRLESVDNGQSINGNRTWHKIRKGSLTGYISAYYATCVN